MKIKNTLNTLNIATGTDLIFEPLEVKDLESDIAESILRLGTGFEKVDEIVDVHTPSDETDMQNTADPLVCPVCGFKAKSAFGLRAHMRKHK
jgi:hypothetical protein